MRTSRALLALPALALALVLTGCGGDDESGSASREPESSSTATTSDPSDSPAPDDGVVTTDVVTFAAPDGWTAVTPDEAQDMVSGEQLEENGADLLERTGLSADEMIQLLGQFDAVAVSDRGVVDGFFDNLNVSIQPGALAKPEAAAQQLSSSGAEVQDATTTTVGGQDAVAVTYVLPVGEIEVQGRALQVLAGDQTVIITVSTREAETADAAIAAVRDSLELVG